MKTITILLALMFAMMHPVQAQEKSHGIILKVTDEVTDGCWTSPKQLQLKAKAMLEQNGFRVFNNDYQFGEAIDEGSVVKHPYALALGLHALGYKIDRGCAATYGIHAYTLTKVIQGYKHTDESRIMVDFDSLGAGLITGPRTYVSNTITEDLLEYTADFIVDAELYYLKYLKVNLDFLKEITEDSLKEREASSKSD